jgi:hypothetical protein
MDRSNQTNGTHGTLLGTLGSMMGAVLRGRARRLTQVAGKPKSASTSFDQPFENLERRQLMFALTVTPNDDFNPAAGDFATDGIGTTQAYFAYTLPSINPADTQVGQPQVVLEDFNDDAAITAIPDGRLFLAAGVQARHNIPNLANVFLNAILDENGQVGQERFVQLRVGSGQFFGFRFTDPQAQNPNQVFGRPIRQVSFVTRAVAPSPTGLDIDGMRAELRFGGRVISTIEGPALRAASSTGTGVGTFTFIAPPGEAFDEIRLVALRNTPSFVIDDVSQIVPPVRYAQQVSGRIFGGVATIRGPIGASAEFFDLYGRPMQRTLQLGIPTGGTLALVDVDDNGIANFNEGIGRIQMRGTDAQTRFTLWGGTITVADVPPENAEISEGTFHFILPDSWNGLYTQMESAGFGYNLIEDQVVGLPPGPGSIVVGSPFVRPLNDYNPDGPSRDPLLPNGIGNDDSYPINTPAAFKRPDQGVFVNEGSSIGELTIHGIVHGSSRLTGAVERLNFGYLVGSVNVDGDAGSIIIGSDAGRWTDEPQQGDPASVNTGSQIVVGRTLGELSIGGRSSVNLTVVGDLNSPQTRPPRDVYEYSEKEVIYGLDPAADEAVRAAIRAGFAVVSDQGLLRQNLGNPFAGHKIAFNAGSYRNDSILSAEFIGSTSSGVRIKGDLSGRDGVDGEDDGDTYAFAVDGTQDIIIEGLDVLGPGLHYRVLDIDGRVLASTQDQFLRPGSRQMRFRPNEPGVYYLNVIDTAGAGEGGAGTNPYAISVFGMATTTLGMYRVAGNAGGGSIGAARTDTGTALVDGVTVLNGSVGSFRAGTGAPVAGGVANPGGSVNRPVGDGDSQLDWYGGTYSVAGSVFDITAGTDFMALNGTPTNFVIGGDLAALFTGRSPIGGASANEGDINNLRLSVGGRIGRIAAQGSVGLDQDNTDAPRQWTGSVSSITTGTRGGPGDIAGIRFGYHAVGSALNITTSSNSVIGSILVSQDVYTDFSDLVRTGIYASVEGFRIRTGAGSDVRFFDTPWILERGSADQFLPIRAGQGLELVDDAGSRIRITVEGAPEPIGTVIGQVRVQSIDGSQGVAIGQILLGTAGATDGALQRGLLAGEILRIEGVGQPRGRASIGRIVLPTADPTSQVIISGSVEIDVFRTEVLAGGLNLLANDTPNGDLVAVDVASLGTLRIETGDLGRTQVPAFGPQLIGPFLGLASGESGGVRGEIGVPPAAISVSWNGDIYRGPADANLLPDQARLEDLGAPANEYLNGLVVRSGTLAAVNVGGSIGNVYALAGQGADDANGVIGTITANFDGITPEGRFDGINGVIYAASVGVVNIGDGIAPRTSSPMASSGIFVLNTVGRVFATSPTANIQAPIVAFNSVVGQVIAINEIELNGGRLDGAYVAADLLDTYWDTNLGFPESPVYTGSINRIGSPTGTLNIVRSDITAQDITLLDLGEGIWDASSVQVGGDLTRISAREFRNSSIRGEDLELRENAIIVKGQLVELATTNGTGDISDLDIDVSGDVVNPIIARNITRTSFNVDNTIAELRAANLRASEVITGAIPRIIVSGDIVSSTFLVSGPVDEINAANRILNSRISITGPDGRLGRVTAGTLLTGEVASTGEIREVSSGGDIIGRVSTSEPGANVLLIFAGRDAAVTADIAGGLDRLIAGRHVGGLRPEDRGEILIRGDLFGEITATRGQLYNEVRVGGDISGRITVGAAAGNVVGNDRVGAGSIVAAGFINRVDVIGDFNGDIISYSGGIGSVFLSGGSFFQGRTIAAYEGSVQSVVIDGGHLLGNVYAEQDIVSLVVAPSADGVFGDVGINPALSSTAGYDNLRNQLPLGLAQLPTIQGPRIEAGRDIVNVEVRGGSAFESAFIAGRDIGRLFINGDLRNDDRTQGIGSFIAAGDSLFDISVSGAMRDSLVIAGITSFGNDRRPGGSVGGVNGDTNKPGVIRSVFVGGGAERVRFSSGMTAGVNGIYNDADDRQVLGLSEIQNVDVRGNILNVTAWGDEITGALRPEIVRGGFDLPSANPLLDNGQAAPFAIIPPAGSTFTLPGGTVNFRLAGPGQAFYDPAANRLTIRGTTSGSDLFVTATGTIGNGLTIRSNDQASLRLLRMTGNFAVGTTVLIDGDVGAIETNNLLSNITVGNNLGTVSTADFLAGSITAQAITGIAITGNFGNTNRQIVGEVRISALSLGSLQINGAARGAVSVSRDAGAVAVGGAVERSTFRFGGSLGSFTGLFGLETLISARDRIDAVSFVGDLTDSSIIAGWDLGADGLPGGTGLNADTLTTGFVGNVSVGGNFRESDVVAGVARGADGFFGTSDDTVAGGRSSIAAVSIAGTQVGSTRSSERYLVGSSGSVGPVRVAGQTVTNRGNFSSRSLALPPAALRVDSLRIVNANRTYTANIEFNQPIDAATLRGALSVSEVRGVGDVTIRLIDGVDYFVNYDDTTNFAQITFARAVIDQNLPTLPGQPNAGVYRFQLDPRLLKARVQSAQLDGDGDGFVEAFDPYSVDDIVGDAGDKAVAVRLPRTGTGVPAGEFVDMYGPINLNTVLDGNTAANGLPDPNVAFVIRGFLGDHPDNNTSDFRFTGDVDVYTVTLRAGQILLLSELRGTAELATLTVTGPTGTAINANLPSRSPTDRDRPFGTFQGGAFLIPTTGVYTITLGPTALANEIPNPEPVPGVIGDYEFSVEVFDDLDTGFSGDTDSGNGAPVVDAPNLDVFAGPDRIFGNADDLASVVIGSFTFTFDRGPDGVAGTGDDLATGDNGNGITSTRDATGRLVQTISSTIGSETAAGIPSANITPDVDVFHLNGRSSIAPGTKLRITVKLAELGANFGTRQFDLGAGSDRDPSAFSDFRGSVQFGVFDTSVSTGLSDANLVFSPTDFKTTGGTPNSILADNGSTRYGFDANGDYFIEFVTPERLGQPGTPGSFAIYIQGVFNSDYQIEVVTDGIGSSAPRGRQNVFLETGGGQIDWLSAFGDTTRLAAFTSRTLGFSGGLQDGTPIQTVILNQLVSTLNTIYQSAGYDVRFSTNSRDFEFQDFSTVYLSSGVDPINLVFSNTFFDPLAAFFGDTINTFDTAQPFGASQRSDPFNADLNDDAVVFVPSFGLLGLSQSDNDRAAFVQSLSNAIGRRVGELTGLRITDDSTLAQNPNDPTGAPILDVMASNSPVFTVPNWRLRAESRALSGDADSTISTNFFLGRQSGVSLLDQILGRI